MTASENKMIKEQREVCPRCKALDGQIVTLQ